MSINELHSSERVHIVFVGKRNSGKSSLINAISGQDISIVSDTPGTTTDPVKKVMEVSGIGPCVIVDTAGFDDVGELGSMRVEKTRLATRSADLVVAVLNGEDNDHTAEIEFVKTLGCKNILYVLNKTDIGNGDFDSVPEPKIKVSAFSGKGIDELIKIIATYAPEKIAEPTVTGNLVKKGDTVLLIMPQDESAPKGRLILPQVQVIRELLDKGAVPVCTTLESLPDAMATLKGAPDLVITDSQVFGKVVEIIPNDWKLTSFSVLFAAYKGDIKLFINGAEAIDTLTTGSKVLIAEACSHTTTDADVARVKIPNLLHKKINPDIEITVVSGSDFPDDVSGYDLVIHCGACMFNKAHVMSRADICAKSGTPMTNYGIAIAHLTGILNRVILPM